MLKSKNCRNNFGKVSSAAREYNKFIPLIEKEPALFALMMTGMSAYSAMCGRYPAGFSRYISERLWETALEEQEESTIDWEKIDDEIDGRDF